jgi:hypothetical protein
MLKASSREGLGWAKGRAKGGKGREGKGREGKGREGKGREGYTTTTRYRLD